MCHLNQISIIKSAIERTIELESSAYSLGSVCILGHALYRVESEYIQCCKSFQSYIETPQPTHAFSAVIHLEASFDDEYNSSSDDDMDNVRVIDQNTLDHLGSEYSGM